MTPEPPRTSPAPAHPTDPADAGVEGPVPGQHEGEDLLVERRDPPGGRAHLVVLVVAGLTTLASAAALVASLVTGGGPSASGAALAVAAAAAAVLVRRGHAATLPYREWHEPRHVEPLEGPLAPVGTPTGRRALLAGGVVAGAGLVVGSLVAPPSIAGPRPVRMGTATGWSAGTRLVDGDAVPLRPADVPPGGLSTVWPEGGERLDVDAVVLVRLSAPPRPPTNGDWVVDGQLVAYSKACTHMGCPVGLLQEGEGSLFCPCHQAHFDAAQGAQVMFGPPPRPLPQLPMGVDGDGYLIALDDFADHVGPTTGRTR